MQASLSSNQKVGIKNSSCSLLSMPCFGSRWSQLVRMHYVLFIDCKLYSPALLSDKIARDRKQTNIKPLSLGFRKGINQPVNFSLTCVFGLGRREAVTKTNSIELRELRTYHSGDFALHERADEGQQLVKYGDGVDDVDLLQSHRVSFLCKRTTLDI